MSEENVEIVRRAFEAATAKPPDVESLNGLYSPDHELTTDWGAAEAERYLGLAGFREALADMDRYLNDWHRTCLRSSTPGTGGW